MVRAGERTVPIVIADRTNSAAPKLAGEIDIERFPAARTGMRANGSAGAPGAICVRVRGGALLSGIAAPNRRSILILILIRTRPLAVAVIIAAVIVVVAVVVGRTGGGRADCCGAVGCTSRVIPSGVAGDRTTRAAGYGIAGSARATDIPVSAPTVDTSGAASDVGGPRAAAMKSSTAAKASSTATTASTRQGVIWNQTGGQQNGRCKPDQTVPNHGIPPNAGVPCATDGFQQ